MSTRHYQKLLQQMIGVTLVMLLLVGCGAPAATSTRTPVPPAVTSAPPPTCLKEPPPGLLIFGLVGNFEPPQPPPIEESLNPETWNAARLLVCDDSFFIQHERGDYNLWTGLLEVEESISADEIPHMAGGVKKTVGAIVEEYGEPSFVGEFRCESGKSLNVYWFGPIFIMAEGLDGENIEIGGWLSLLK